MKHKQQPAQQSVAESLNNIFFPSFLIDNIFGIYISCALNIMK
jgi:hypothetical protein